MPSKTTGKTTKARYAEHPGVAMERNTVAKLKEKTGRSLEEWTVLVLKKGPKAVKERVAWLKGEHGLGTNYATWLAQCAGGATVGDYDPEGLVTKMFADRPGLQPIYEALLKLAFALGKDVTVTPCATIVPIRRRYVIAQLKPTTKTRVDLGLALGGTKVSGRLVDTGGFAKKDRITHRIPITSLAEIDTEVKRWLKVAYDRDA